MDLRAGQLRPGLRGGRLDQQFQGVRAVQREVRVGSQGGGEVLAQRAAQPLEGAGAFPDQGLVGAGDNLDGLRLLAVPGHRPQLGPVDADHVGQRVRVSPVALGAGGGIAFLEPGDLPRVDGIDLVAGGDQGLYPGAAVGLDPDHHFGGIQVPATVLREELVQLPDPLHTFGQSRRGEFVACLVLDLDVMVVFGPVVADQQQLVLLVRCFAPCSLRKARHVA